MTRIVLASTSPRRKEILSGIVGNFETVSPDVSEITEGEPLYVAETNAALKGRSVSSEGAIVIACDTVVSLDGVIYGKPGNFENAVKTLTALAGKTHEVIGGVYMAKDGEEKIFGVKSFVTLKKLTPEEITDYVGKYRPFDKAGAYGIQDGAVTESYEGDYDNIVGLPSGKIKEVLYEFGFEEN